MAGVNLNRFVSYRVKAALFYAAFVVAVIVMSPGIFSAAPGRSPTPDVSQIADEHADILAVIHVIPGGLMNADGTGAHADLSKELFARVKQRMNRNFKLILFPALRAADMFRSGQAQIFVATLEEESSVHVEVPLGLQAYKFIVGRKNRTLASSFNDLEGKTVGTVFGWYYPDELIKNQKITIESVKSVKQNLVKLDLHRIDYAILSSVDIPELMKAGVSHYAFDLDKRIAVKNAVLRFHNDEEGQKLAVLFAEALQELKEEGIYRKILLKHNISPYLFADPSAFFSSYPPDR